MKIWRPALQECQHCGDDIESLSEEVICDGDEARCVGCGAKGGAILFETGEEDVISFELELPQSTPT